MSIGNFLKGTNYKLVLYGIFANWGLVVVSNMIGFGLLRIIGIDLVNKFSPFLYAILSLIFFFPTPKSRDFKIGYMIGFVIGLVFLLLFYYPTFIGN